METVDEEESAACLALVMCLTLGRLWREGGRDALRRSPSTSGWRP